MLDHLLTQQAINLKLQRIVCVFSDMHYTALTKALSATEQGYQKGSSGFFVELLRFAPFSNQTSDRPSSSCILDLLCRLDCMRPALPGGSEQHTAHSGFAGVCLNVQGKVQGCQSADIQAAEGLV